MINRYLITRYLPIISILPGLLWSTAALSQNAESGSLMTMDGQPSPLAVLDHTTMHQQLVDVSSRKRQPRLALEIRRDTMDGFNLRLNLEHFLMESPPHKPNDETNTRSKHLRGHAHVYLNGVKLIRIYGNEVHLPERVFTSGINSLEVSLNAHDHRQFALGAIPLKATLLIDPAREHFVLSHFSPSPICERSWLGLNRKKCSASRAIADRN